MDKDQEKRLLDCVKESHNKKINLIGGIVVSSILSSIGTSLIIESKNPNVYEETAKNLKVGSGFLFAISAILLITSFFSQKF